MTDPATSRRQFLKTTVRAGVAATLATAIWPPVAPAYAQGGLLIPVPQGLDVLKLPEVQRYMAAGTGSLWVAGRFLNSFRNNLNFENLPYKLKIKYHLAGGEWKSLPAARGLYESVPAPIRAAGPDAVWKFHKGKDWTYIVPRSVGGPATADNGIWWSTMKKWKLGTKEMNFWHLADARLILLSEAVRATVVQTLNGMVKGALIGVVAGALMACLECGLVYAEGKITWAEMIDKIVKTSIVAGLGGLIVAGVIVGISLLFPFLIPIFAPLMFALQIVTLLFLGRQLITLAQGWWEVLDGEQKLADFVDILNSAHSAMYSAYNELKEDGFDSVDSVLERVQALAKRVGIDNVWQSIATRTQLVMDRAGELADSLTAWDNLSGFDAGDMGEVIANVVASEFEGAITNTEGLLKSISDYRGHAHLRNVPLI